MTEILRKRMVLKLFMLLLATCYAGGAFSQATVSHPFAVGTGNCGSGTQWIHYYNYNPNSNLLSTKLDWICQPQLRIGNPANGTQRFTSSMASVSYNPKDQKLYYMWINTGASGGTITYAWSWPIGTCPGTTSNKLDTIRSFKYFVLGVAFDADGNGWMLEFSTGSAPYKAYIRSIDFSTGSMGARDELELTGGAKIYNSSSGDVTMSPSGQMFFVVNNKLFTPDYKSYEGNGKKLTTTYIDTIRAPGNLVGLTYADGEMIGTWNAPNCPFHEINPITGGRTSVNKQNGTYAASDLATVITGVGAAKQLVSVTPTGTPNQYNVVYDVKVHNFGNYPLTGLKLTDDLGNINGDTSVSNVSVSFLSNPSGLTLNGAYDGVNNTTLISSGSLAAWPVADNQFSVRINCTLSNIQPGRIYNNSAYVTATGFKGDVVKDSSTNGNEPDLNMNDKPDDVGESQPTPLLISVTAQTPPCMALQKILYTENFGSGSNSITLPGSTASTEYIGSAAQPINIDRFLITSNANDGDNGRWNTLTDYNGGGRMMVVNADAANKVFFSDRVNGLCAGQQYSVIFQAAFIGNPSYKTICDAFGGFKFPRVMMTIRDPNTDMVITQIPTVDITNLGWQQYGLKFVLPSGFSDVVFELSNDAAGGCGNDIALDNIQFGACDALPTVSTTAPSAGCLTLSTTFRAIPNDPAVIPGPKDYQWQISSNGVNGWTDLGTPTTSEDYTISPLTAYYVGKYYRVIMAAQGNLGSVSCRDTSNVFQLTGKSASTAPTSVSKNKLRICPGEPVTIQANGGTPGTNGVYRWYAGGCGSGVAIGTGTSITVSPNTTTTYYVRLEDDCGNTSCVSIQVLVSCDIDKDKDGILDTDESGGVNPFLDSDFDGIEDYQDADTPGFVDSNSDGIDDRYDRDLDGIINALDLDSDNDGIPDVVEAGGVDANGDGRIDNFSDADNDGLSDNVDAAVGIAGSIGLGLPDFDSDGVPNYFDLDSDNDGIPDIREVLGTDSNNDGKIDGFVDIDTDGLADSVDPDTNNDGTMDHPARPLLRTGADANNDGRADSYPFKNLDKDARPNPYDVDSDGDGISDLREAGFPDADNNGIADGVRNSHGWSATIAAMPGPLAIRNSDTDANPDFLDIDSDNDGIPDNVEGLSTSNYQLPTGIDTDGDGLDNRYDLLNSYSGNGITPNDQDGDGIPDYLDVDSDNDGQPDVVEGNDFNGNFRDDDDVSLTGTDTDGDGLDDRFDADNTSAKGTSRYMGGAGSISGDPLPGTRSTLQSTQHAQADRDWRFSSSVLEVNILSFSGIRTGENVRLNWKITSDRPIVHFMIERSTDGAHFSKIAQVPGAAELSIPLTFGYIDNIGLLNGTTVYYRVTAVSSTGGEKTTQVISIKKQTGAGLNINPNPASAFVTISIDVLHDGMIEANVLDASGRVVLRQKQQVFKGSNNFPLDGVHRLSEGVYNVMVNNGGVWQNKKLIIQR